MPHKTAAARAAYQKQYKLDHPALYADSQARYRASGKKRRTDLMRLFEVTEEVYQAMFDAQGGVCKICGKPEPQVNNGVVQRLALDHDHSTNRLRGLLCSNCNRALGQFQDSVDILLSAVRYILEVTNV